MLNSAVEMKTINPQMDLTAPLPTLDDNNEANFCSRVYSRYKQIRTEDQRIKDTFCMIIGFSYGAISLYGATREYTKFPIDGPIILGTFGSILMCVGCIGLLPTINAYCKAILVEKRNLNLYKLSRNYNDPEP